MLKTSIISTFLYSKNSKVNSVIQKDCVEFLRELESESIDLIIADPPYNLKKDFGNRSDRWDSVHKWMEWNQLWIDECVRVLKSTGSIFIFGIHRYLCYIHCYLYEKDLEYRRQIIWYYENGFAGYATLNAFYEPLLWFSKSARYTYHPIREPYKSQERIKNKIFKNGKEWVPNPEGRLAGDVWRFPTLAGKRFEAERTAHPTQKPLALADRLVRHFSNPGDLVLIPFAGSGTECVSCVRNQRNFLASELNGEYISIAEKRLRDAINIQESLVIR